MKSWSMLLTVHKVLLGQVRSKAYFMQSICFWTEVTRHNIHLDRIKYATGPDLTHHNITYVVLGPVKSILYEIQMHTLNSNTKADVL